jgi:hypothetical protein
MFTLQTELKCKSYTQADDFMLKYIGNRSQVKPAPDQIA